MTTPSGERIERLPAWITRVTQDLSVSPIYDARFWNPPQPYKLVNPRPPKPRSAKVYEAHGKLSTDTICTTWARSAHFLLQLVSVLRSLG